MVAPIDGVRDKVVIHTWTTVVGERGVAPTTGEAMAIWRERAGEPD